MKLGRDVVALFRLEDGRIFAVDNRCPHEGYPLASGAVNGDPLLPGLLTSIALGTREDLLPPWTGTRRRLEIVASDLPRWAALVRMPIPGWERADDTGPSRLAEAVLDGGPAESRLRPTERSRGGPSDSFCPGPCDDPCAAWKPE